MADEIRIPYPSLVQAIEDALAGAGVPALVRQVEAEVMAEADLLGVPSHGVRMLPSLLQGLREGRANPDPQLKVLHERAAVCTLDGDRGPGRWVSVQAMSQAVARSQTFGVGICLATRVTHWGRAHAYAYRAALAGVIGLCTTNAIPSMVGWGSSRPILGNNPLAIGVPSGANHDPIVLDIAMSQAAVGKIVTYVREGKPAEPGWGLDASGRPTNDPAAILASKLLLPMAGHKGAGLALMMEILTGALAGGLLSQEMVKTDASGLDAEASKFFLAINVADFVDPQRFAQRVADLLSALEAGFDPGQEFLYPGARGWQVRERNLALGVPIHPQILAQLKSAGINLVGQ
jgi:LDH2 family malate/lactate/ureidoglycolate dehydrogenase